MDARSGFESPYSDEKSHIELDMDEDLKLGGDSDEKGIRRRTSNAINSFVSCSLSPLGETSV